MGAKRAKRAKIQRKFSRLGFLGFCRRERETLEDDRSRERDSAGERFEERRRERKSQKGFSELLA